MRRSESGKATQTPGSPWRRRLNRHGERFGAPRDARQRRRIEYAACTGGMASATSCLSNHLPLPPGRFGQRERRETWRGKSRGKGCVEGRIDAPIRVHPLRSWILTKSTSTVRDRRDGDACAMSDSDAAAAGVCPWSTVDLPAAPLLTRPSRPFAVSGHVPTVARISYFSIRLRQSPLRALRLGPTASTRP